MKIKTTTIIFALFTVFAFVACDIRDGEEYCPTGQIELRFYAERFRNASDNPLDDREEIFADRIQHLRYYLYKDNELYDTGLVDDLSIPVAGSSSKLIAKASSAQRSYYGFTFDGLDFGEYQMVIVANCTKDALSGDPKSCSNLLLTFNSCHDTEDYFTSVFNFKVDSDIPKTYEVGLLRAHGVIRYTFENLPADVAGIEVTVDNVAMEKWVTGDYKNVCKANMRYIIPSSNLRADPDYIMATFPTLPDGKAIYHLNLYRDGEDAPYLSQMISDTLTVRRNQLLEINSIFNDGSFTFNINLDSEWDGSSSGGNGEVS